MVGGDESLLLNASCRSECQHKREHELTYKGILYTNYIPIR